MAHLTAGDITPIGHIRETTYGTTPEGSYTYYGAIREGGNITPTDNPNPYVNWRYGSRLYDSYDYVNQQHEAGFTDAIEVYDTADWSDILVYAGLGVTGSLRSRSVIWGYLQNISAADRQYAMKYIGCKTDQLRISADVPGGVVGFDETVLASYRQPEDEATGTVMFPSEPPASTAPAVQWLGGLRMNNTYTYYPQSFSLTIRNNLGRADIYDTDLGKTKAVVLAEGRQEIELEATLWMEDFSHLVRNMDNRDTLRRINLDLTLGLDNPDQLHLVGAFMADGNNQALVQDKQLQTVRYRISSASMTLPTATAQTQS